MNVCSARLLGCLAVIGLAVHGTRASCTTDSVPGYTKLGSGGICTGSLVPISAGRSSSGVVTITNPAPQGASIDCPARIDQSTWASSETGIEEFAVVVHNGDVVVSRIDDGNLGGSWILDLSFFCTFSASEIQQSASTSVAGCAEICCQDSACTGFALRSNGVCQTYSVCTAYHGNHLTSDVFQRTDMDASASDGCGCSVGPASCGDKDGAGGGAISNADCGTGFVYDASAASAICDGDGSNGNVCAMALDHDKCCTPITCSNKDGVGGGRVTNLDCGNGYLRDGSALGSLCTGADGCDMTALSADHSACCKRQATCGDTTGAGGPAITDADCGAARGGFVHDSSATGSVCTSSGGDCDVSTSQMVDFSTCCTAAPPPPLPLVWPPPPPPATDQHPTKKPANDVEPHRNVPAEITAPAAPSLPHHGFTPPKIRDNIDTDFTFSPDALMDASSRFTFAESIDFSAIRSQLSKDDMSRSIQLVSSTSKARSPVWVLPPSDMIVIAQTQISGDNSQALAPLVWGEGNGRDRRRGSHGVGNNFWSTPALSLSPNGRMFVLYVERRTADLGSDVIGSVLFELFASTSSQTGLGEFVARADVWGTTQMQATVHADDAFKLAYTNHGVGNEHILIFNCNRDIPTVAVNLRTYKGVARSIPMLTANDVGKESYISATKFTFIPEGIDHYGVTYDMLAVSSSGTSVYVYLASSVGSTGIVSLQVFLTDGASPMDEEFDIYSAPGTTNRPTPIYLSSAVAVHALSWATMVSMPTGATFALATLQEPVNTIAAGTPVCFTFNCPRGTLKDQKSAIFDVPCTNGHCTAEQCCVQGQKSFPGQSPILTAEARVKIKQQLSRFTRAQDDVVAEAASTDEGGVMSSERSKDVKAAKKEPSYEAVTGANNGDRLGHYNVNSIGAIVFGVMLGIVGAIIRGRRQTNGDDDADEQDPLMAMPIPSTRTDRRERADQFPAMHVPEELEDYKAPVSRVPWYSVYRGGADATSPNSSRFLEGGSASTPNPLKSALMSSPSQVEGGAILSPRSRKRSSKRSPQPQPKANPGSTALISI